MKSLFRWLVLTALVFLLAACHDVAPPPCEEKISDPQAIEKIVKTNPVIQQLSAELTLREVSLFSTCFTRGQVGVRAVFILPKSYSNYAITYSGDLSLTVDKGGDIQISGGIKPPSVFETGAVLEYFRQNIIEMESNPRVQEVIAKTEPDDRNPVIPLFSGFIPRKNNRIQYNFSYGLVRGYLLSNNVDWQKFPEIQKAHQVIEDNLLVGSLSGCKIGRSDTHSYTSADFHDALDGPWFLTVALLCEDGWKDASVRINPDGTYERLGISQEYKNK